MDIMLQLSRLSQLVSHVGHLCSCHTPLVSQNLCLSMWTPTAQGRRLTRSSSPSSARTGICVLVSLVIDLFFFSACSLVLIRRLQFVSLISKGHSTSRPHRTVTLVSHYFIISSVCSSEFQSPGNPAYNWEKPKQLKL